MSRLARRGTEATAGVLALLVHGAFILLLVFGVSWQTQQAAPVMVDLWQALPEPPAPVVEPLPVPPEPPVPVVKEPVVKEVPLPKAPDIALEKKKAEAERRKRIEEVREAQRKALANAARAEEVTLRKLRDKQLAEQKKREAQRKIEEQDLQRRMMEEDLASVTRQIKQAESRAVASRRAAELAGVVGQYKDMISAKVRGNTRLPDNLKGNPQVKFLVRLMPTGEVLAVKMLQGSGNAAYDEAVERAIRKSSPLPLPEDRDARAAFVPEVTLVHRPRE